MLTVHHLENSRSQRVLWLLEELGVPYEIRRYERDRKTMLAPSSLKKVHPLGKSPVVTEDGETVAESGAIIEYVLERHGRGRLVPPAGTAERRRYTYWMHYAEGSAMPLLVMKLVFRRMHMGSPAILRPLVRTIGAGVIRGFIDPQLRTHLSFLESEMAKGEWFAGDEFTAADIQMSFPVEAAALRGGLPGDCPRLRAWLDRCHARPAYGRAMEKGGPFELLS